MGFQRFSIECFQQHFAQAPTSSVSQAQTSALACHGSSSQQHYAQASTSALAQSAPQLYAPAARPTIPIIALSPSKMKWTIKGRVFKDTNSQLRQCSK